MRDLLAILSDAASETADLARRSSALRSVGTIPYLAAGRISEHGIWDLDGAAGDGYDDGPCRAVAAR
jgi:hypothetical protein